MKDIIDVIVSRRSVRKFKPDMLDKTTLDKIIKAGTYAPTGRNKQSPVIIAITNKDVIAKFSEICGEIKNYEKGVDPFFGAPVLISVLANKEVRTFVNDGSLVMANMLLEAHSLGIGACWIHDAKGMFEHPYGKELLNKLGIVGDYEGIGNCILGYAEEYPDKPLPRKDNWVYFVE
ncbi:MAG: nitroreductase [Clostridia bacterium]|nr:nitroreductase [Clostridia bacterium]